MAERGLFSGVFGRGDVDSGDQAWLAAMLDTDCAGQRPGAAGESTLREALLGVPDVRRRLDQAGITTTQIDAALDPASYLGAAGEFTDAALAAHRAAALAPPRDG